ncbi:hypothetical protein ACFT2C_24565 [Promicromonospora sp. NPDC057138]|uniref:hypothetical protein n=1 Tax=Promicromonospora sp. NPDC057138 TaxID=3346031 RepID=UPI00363CE7A6
MNRQRLLHLDLKTVYSYGDQLLFELVRQSFNAWGGGDYFEVTRTSPFREAATSSFVDDVNENFDAVVIGGGGIFPRRNNATAASGWQWNITTDLLKRLRKPIIVFGAGNPAQFEPERHNQVFRKHINQTMSQSIFFGLRSSGAVDDMRAWLDDPASAPQLTMQPCPTTIGRVLLPRAVGAETLPDKRIGIQVGLEAAHVDSGLEPGAIFPQLRDLIAKLQADGWDVEFLGHKRADMKFFQEYGADLGLTGRALFGSTKMLFEGVRHYARLPIVLGARGHSQMIPFGLGNIPLSLSTNNKIRYFAQEIGHPEFLIDPWQGDFASAALTQINAAEAHRATLRTELAATQQRFVDTTTSNLSTIYERLTGDRVVADLVPYSDRELSLAQADYDDDYERRRLVEEGAAHAEPRDFARLFERLERDMGEIKAELTGARGALKPAGGHSGLTLPAGVRRRLRPLRRLRDRLVGT